MHHPRPLPPHLAVDPFSVASALRNGVNRNRLRNDDLEAPFYGIRRAAEPAAAPAIGTESPPDRRERMLRELRARCVAFQKREGRRVVFSHVTAARLWGIPLPHWLELRREIDVAALTPDHAPQGAGVVGHRLRPWRVTPTERFGLEVVSPVDAWVQLGAILKVNDLVIAGDALVRRKHPLATIEQMVIRLEREQRRRGIRKLRAALARIRQGTDSARETSVRLLIVDAGLPEPVIGHTIVDADGFFVATPDLAYVRERVAIEYEGEHHQRDRRTYVEDISRRAAMERAGWAVFLVVAEHVSRPALLTNRLGTLLASRRHRP